MLYLAAAVERAMKVQEVILRALSGTLAWLPRQEHQQLGLLDLPSAGKLTLQDGPESRRHGEHAPILVLCFARLPAEPPSREVHVRLLSGQDLRFDAPAGDVRRLEGGSQVVGQVGEKGTRFPACCKACDRRATISDPRHSDIQTQT